MIEILDFLADIYIILIIISLFLIFALIGYFVKNNNRKMNTSTDYLGEIKLQFSQEIKNVDK